MSEYTRVKSITVASTEKLLSPEDFCIAIKKSRRIGYYMKYDLPLKSAIFIYGAQFLIDNNYIEEVKKRYKIEVTDGVIGEEHITICVAEESGGRVANRILLYIESDGKVMVCGGFNEEVAKTIGFKLNRDGGIIIDG